MCMSVCVHLLYVCVVVCVREESFFMQTTRVTMCAEGLPFVKGLTEHMCGFACLCMHVCLFVFLQCFNVTGSNCVSWGPPGSIVQVVGPEQLAWGVVRVFGECWGDATGLPWPLSHQTQTVGGRWTGHGHCQRARGATGPRERASQDQMSSHKYSHTFRGRMHS